MAVNESSKPSLVRRLERQRARHRERPAIVRVLYVAVGFVLVAAGAGMLVLPGPAFVVIPIGLALLSLEFRWAERLLGTALRKGEEAKRKAAQTSTKQRVLTATLFVLGVAALVAWALLGDIPLVPV